MRLPLAATCAGFEIKNQKPAQTSTDLCTNTAEK